MTNNDNGRCLTARAATPSGPSPAVLGQADIANAAADRLRAAVALGREQGKLALYFGCWHGAGHYLHSPGGKTMWDARETIPDFPWTAGLLDTGLLKNGKRADVYDGRVFWTAGGKALWYAFYWWDRSVDTRGASNSGFYVRGFGWAESQEAFAYACAQFPKVVQRQKHPLVLQTGQAAQAIEARQGGNGEAGAVHESADPQGCAQNTSDPASLKARGVME